MWQIQGLLQGATQTFETFTADVTDYRTLSEDRVAIAGNIVDMVQTTEPFRADGFRYTRDAVSLINTQAPVQGDLRFQAGIRDVTGDAGETVIRHRRQAALPFGAAASTLTLLPDFRCSARSTSGVERVLVIIVAGREHISWLVTLSIFSGTIRCYSGGEPLLVPGVQVAALESDTVRNFDRAADRLLTL